MLFLLPLQLLVIGGGCQLGSHQSPSGSAFGGAGESTFSRLAARSRAEPASAVPRPEALDGAEPMPRAGTTGGAETSAAATGVDVGGEREPRDVAAATTEMRGAGAPPRPDARREERSLREQLATSSDAVGPALRLAAWLADRERHDEALFVLEQASTRSGEPALRLAHAGLLRDTGRVGEAAAELQSVVRDSGQLAPAPGTLLELAQVELLAGQRERARRTCADLLRVVGDGDWFEAHGEELQQLRAALERPTTTTVSIRDLLAVLRSAPAATTRAELVERLLAKPLSADATANEERDALRERVLAIGCGDPSPAVRARSLRAAAALGRAELELWQVALTDEAALVRAVAADAAVDALAGTGRRDEATALLLSRLQLEEDPSAFTALHRALERTAGVAHEFRLQAVDEAGRAAAREFWQERCRR
ncbi:MAG: hypothetical protein H6835_13215 [Planctomycetes bacterium]|nr:hypothetical protein [Planctomycetota bacterium]